MRGPQDGREEKEVLSDRDKFDGGVGGLIIDKNRVVGGDL